MTPDQITALEAMLSDLSYQDVAHFKNTLEVVLGYMKLHDIDD